MDQTLKEYPNLITNNSLDLMLPSIMKSPSENQVCDTAMNIEDNNTSTEVSAYNNDISFSDYEDFEIDLKAVGFDSDDSESILDLPQEKSMPPGQELTVGYGETQKLPSFDSNFNVKNNDCNIVYFYCDLCDESFLQQQLLEHEMSMKHLKQINNSTITNVYSMKNNENIIESNHENVNNEYINDEHNYSIKSPSQLINSNLCTEDIELKKLCKLETNEMKLICEGLLKLDDFKCEVEETDLIVGQESSPTIASPNSNPVVDLATDIPNQNYNFQCQVCCQVFITKNHLKIHTETHTSPYQCIICGNDYKFLRNLTRHINTKHTSMSLKKVNLEQRSLLTCTICNIEVKNIKSLKTHMLTHNNNFTCICGKIFFNFDKFMKHHNSNHTTKVCDVCSQTFQKKSELKNHFLTEHPILPDNLFGKKKKETLYEKIHDKINSSFRIKSESINCLPLINNTNDQSENETCKKEFTCEYCFKQFNSEMLLKLHVISYIKEVAKTCYICNIKFNTILKLNEHFIKYHKSGNNFICNICNLTFNSPYILNSHASIHIKIKSFNCLTCTQEFTHLCDLISHNTTESCVQVCCNDKSRNNNVCNSCGGVFCGKIKSPFSKVNLSLNNNVDIETPSTHVELENQVENNSESAMIVCENSIPVEDLAKKLEQTNKTCPLCFKVFTDSHSLAQHLKSHLLKCPICGKVFTIMKNIKSHLQTKHYFPTTSQQELESSDVSKESQLESFEMLQQEHQFCPPADYPIEGLQENSLLRPQTSSLFENPVKGQLENFETLQQELQSPLSTDFPVKGLQESFLRVRQEFQSSPPTGVPVEDSTLVATHQQLQSPLPANSPVKGSQEGGMKLQQDLQSPPPASNPVECSSQQKLQPCNSTVKSLLEILLTPQQKLQSPTQTDIPVKGPEESLVKIKLLSPPCADIPEESSQKMQPCSTVTPEGKGCKRKNQKIALEPVPHTKVKRCNKTTTRMSTEENVLPLLDHGSSTQKTTGFSKTCKKVKSKRCNNLLLKQTTPQKFTKADNDSGKSRVLANSNATHIPNRHFSEIKRKSNRILKRTYKNQDTHNSNLIAKKSKIVVPTIIDEVATCSNDTVATIIDEVAKFDTLTATINQVATSSDIVVVSKDRVAKSFNTVTLTLKQVAKKSDTMTAIIDQVAKSSDAPVPIVNRKSKPSAKYYKCPFCLTICTNIRSFNNHVSSKCTKSRGNIVKFRKNKNLIFECFTCQINFKSLLKYNSHVLNQHRLKKRYNCKQCKKYFVYKCMLNRHNTNVHC